MSVFRQNEAPPPWCQLKAFEIIDLGPGGEMQHLREQPKARALCTQGTVQLMHGSGSTVLKENQFFDLHTVDEGRAWSVRACAPTAQLVVLSGTWGDDISGCGIFRVAEEPGATNIGDPVDYPKKTRVDPHYHDCDEYWILLEGRATVVVGGTSMDMGVGDAVSIGMGHHHDMPLAPEPVKAVFFETTLEREKRIGHLWNYTHGQAQPHPERI